MHALLKGSALLRTAPQRRCGGGCEIAVEAAGACVKLHDDILTSRWSPQPIGPAPVTDIPICQSLTAPPHPSWHLLDVLQILAGRGGRFRPPRQPPASDLSLPPPGIYSMYSFFLKSSARTDALPSANRLRCARYAPEQRWTVCCAVLGKFHHVSHEPLVAADGRAAAAAAAAAAYPPPPLGGGGWRARGVCRGIPG